VSTKAHYYNQKTFRELSLSQMRASIASMQHHVNDAKRVYKEEKQSRVPGKRRPAASRLRSGPRG
jgi:hypothetical protein